MYINNKIKEMSYLTPLLNKRFNSGTVKIMLVAPLVANILNDMMKPILN